MTELQHEEPQQVMIQELSKPQRKISYLGIANSVLCVGLIVTSIVLYTKLQDTNERMDAVASKYEEANNKIKALGADAETATRIIKVLYFQHLTEEGIVTDELVVNKVNFYNASNEPLDIILDVANQPSTALKYKGKGAYEMQDREVKAMASRIVEDLKSRYNEFADSSMDKWTDAAVVRVTVQNYEIGTYKAGKFTLKGE